MGATVALCFFSSPLFSTEYIYRDLMANTVPSAKCESQAKAEISAKRPFKIKRFSKKFCQTQGYGWGLKEVTNNGQIACNECTDNKDLQKCYLKDVSVTCKRIKPGTVGMLPGQG